MPQTQEQIGVNKVAEILGIEWRTALNRVNRGEFGDVSEVHVGHRVFRLVDASKVRRIARERGKKSGVAS